MPYEPQSPDTPAVRLANGFHAAENACDRQARPGTPAAQDAAVPQVEAILSPGAASSPHPAVALLPVLEAVQKFGLLILSCIYALGYVAWAYHARRYNLGPLPALQTQYLTAGLAPALIIGVTVFCIGITSRILRMVGGLFLPDASPYRKHLSKAAVGLYWLAWTTLIFLLAVNTRHSLSAGAFCLALSCFHIAASGTILALRLHDKTFSASMRLDFTDWPVVLALPVVVGALILYVYVAFAFRNMPQEYGGARPRIAQLEVSRDSLSHARLKALFLPDAAGGYDKIVVSRSLYVFFAGSQSLLVKPYARWTSNRAYEVETSTIKGITWLDGGGFALQEPVRISKGVRSHSAAQQQ